MFTQAGGNVFVYKKIIGQNKAMIDFEKEGIACIFNLAEKSTCNEILKRQTK
jgi:hypothetical protein